MNFTNIFTVKLSKSETIERINNLVFTGYPANEIDSGKLKGNRITYYKKDDIPVYEFSVYANEETTDIEFKHNGDEFAKVLIDTLVHKLSVSLTGEGKRLEIEKLEIEKKESETELESKVIIRSKPRKAGYDAAFEKMINEKISYKQAYEFWKENFPDEYEALATKQDGINNTFDAFKSAMKYRKNKGMGE